MSYVTVGKENSTNIDLYYEDHGAGSAVILIHGYPLDGASWEKQIPVLLAAGHRVITYDRRGFGKSSQPTIGYNYDTFAADLRKLITHLKLDKFALVGFSMGGGKVAGTDRCAFFSEFFKNFYNTDVLLGKRISEQAVQASSNVAASASPTASLACVSTWHEDFRNDVARIDVPTLVIHGDADRIVPIAASGRRTAKLVKGARLIEIKDGPHAVGWTHAEEVNSELVNFLGKGVALSTSASQNEAVA